MRTAIATYLDALECRQEGGHTASPVAPTIGSGQTPVVPEPGLVPEPEPILLVPTYYNYTGARGVLGPEPGPETIPSPGPRKRTRSRNK